jgi:hypothetical protein
MPDDIIFNSNYFFIDLGDFGSGTINGIEAQTEWFVLTIRGPETVIIF